MRTSLMFSRNAILVFLIALPNITFCQPGLALKCKACTHNPNRVIRPGNQDGQPFNRRVSPHSQSPKNSGYIGSPIARHKIRHQKQVEISNLDNQVSRQYSSDSLFSRSKPMYPVASKVAKINAYEPDWTKDESSSSESWDIERLTLHFKWNLNVPSESIDLSYNPLFGHKILTNVPEFFEDVFGNLQALSKLPALGNEGDITPLNETGLTVPESK